MPKLRSNLIRIAATLPKGDPTRGKLLAALQNKTALSSVAKTILEQMGGMMRLGMMLGLGKPPYFFSDIPNGVQWMWPNRQRSKGNLVKITLRGDDTYDMEFINASIRGHKSVKKYSGIYNDQLVDLFEKQTAWYLKMGSAHEKSAASGIEFGDLPPGQQQLARATGLRPQEAWEGIHGYIVNFKPQAGGSTRVNAATMKKIVGNPLFRWISANRGGGFTLGM